MILNIPSVFGFQMHHLEHMQKKTSKSEQIIFLSLILMNFFLHTFQIILRKKIPKPKLAKKNSGYFFKSSETYADPSLNEIVAKQNFLS